MRYVAEDMCRTIVRSIVELEKCTNNETML
jgi:hypothetical protein